MSKKKKRKMSVVTVPEEGYMNRISPWMLTMIPKNRYFHYYMVDSQCHYTNDKCQFCWLATRNTSIDWAHFYWFPSAKSFQPNSQHESIHLNLNEKTHVNNSRIEKSISNFRKSFQFLRSFVVSTTIKCKMRLHASNNFQYSL